MSYGVIPQLRASSPKRERAPRLPYLSPLARARALMARPWFARCYGGSSPTRGVAPKQHRGGPRLPYLSPLRGREGADGQAVVCPLLRGSSPTRSVAPKQHQGLRRAFSPAFRAGSLYPLAGGCRTIWRGEAWLRRARCGPTGSGRLGGAAAAGRTMEFRFIDFRGALPLLSPLRYARARALLARPWSARCYGVARQRDRSRQNSIRPRYLFYHPYVT